MMGEALSVMRDKTDRAEGVEAGVVRLVAGQNSRFVSEAARFLCDRIAHATMATEVIPLGDAQENQRILIYLLTRSAGVRNLAKG